jgi:hypothetical protein
MPVAVDPCTALHAQMSFGRRRRWPSKVRSSPDGVWLAASGRDGVDLWRRDGSGPFNVEGPHGSQQRLLHWRRVPPHRLLVEGAQVTTLAVSADGKLLATGTTTGRLLLLPISGSRPIELGGFQGLVYAIAFDATARRIAATGRISGRPHEVVRIFDLQTGDVKILDPGDGHDVASVAFLPRASHSSRIATCSLRALAGCDASMSKLDRLNACPYRQGSRFSVPTADAFCCSRPRTRTSPSGRLPYTTCKATQGRGLPVRCRCCVLTREWSAHPSLGRAVGSAWPHGPAFA